METFTLMVWLTAGSAAPLAEFPGLTEYQCEYRRVELRKELPKIKTSCEPIRDGNKRTTFNPVHRYWN